MRERWRQLRSGGGWFFEVHTRRSQPYGHSSFTVKRGRVCVNKEVGEFGWVMPRTVPDLLARTYPSRSEGLCSDASSDMSDADASSVASSDAGSDAGSDVCSDASSDESSDQSADEGSEVSESYIEASDSKSCE